MTVRAESDSSPYPADQLVEDLANLLDDRLDDDSLAYLHSRDLSDDLDANARRIGRNLVDAADRADLHAEKWSHNGRSTTWLVEDRDDQEADR
ncbi:hypothetical protein ACOZ4L_02655 [Haloplanus ruber]|uniref:DUF7123 domain-containing protein n=1 Tax=Haloplanus ruber TaxID=869892 RepID=A0ABD6D0C3_9EURY|nr:hypothetical protein [Haloplanus ruber]